MSPDARGHNLQLYRTGNMLTSPNILTIDLQALAFNLAQIKRHVGRGVKIMGIVKSDAYGHGLVKVSKTLEKEGISCLGVSFISEALLLRKEGIKIPVVVLCGVEKPDDAQSVIEKDLTPVVFDIESAVMLDRAADISGKKINIHIKVDTGMGRLGADYDKIAWFLCEIKKLRALNVEGLLSHFSSADEDDRTFTDKQTERFKNVISEAKTLGIEPELNHLANSAGIMSHNNSYFNMVRPGIILYGGLPFPGYEPPFELRPVMGLKGKILQIRDFDDNTPVSYGRTYHTKGRKSIAVISAGYADGLPRSLSNRGRVLAGGKRADITGTVCMNMLACDITENRDLKPGDECVLLGSQGKETINVDDIAGWCNTISYEILLSLGRASEKIYIS